MGPIGALDSVFSKYFTIRGRASRSEYWWFVLMYTIILCFAIWGDLIFFDPTKPMSLNPFAYFTGAWMIVTIIPHFTVTVRRLHDSGKAGYWYLVILLPLGGLILLVLMLLPSDYGDNAYGQAPFGPRGSQYQGHDISNPGLPVKHKAAEPSNPYAGYALLDQMRAGPTPEMIAARKEAVSALYKQRVLGQAPDPEPGEHPA